MPEYSGRVGDCQVHLAQPAIFLAHGKRGLEHVVLTSPTPSASRPPSAVTPVAIATARETT
jgi:hypothetical protein